MGKVSVKDNNGRRRYLVLIFAFRLKQLFCFGNCLVRFRYTMIHAMK